MGQNITTASRQWANRPDDERFVSLEDLMAHVAKRRGECFTTAAPTADLRVLPLTGDDIAIEVHDRTKGGNVQLLPSNWSFSQLSSYAGAPGSYLRKLPSELAAINLQWGLEHSPVREDALVLGHHNGDSRLRAMTSTTYGRIWDEQVVNSVIKANDNGKWVVPSASYTSRDPKRATTLYASDRDVFVFLVDPANPIEVAGEQMFRGFITWNSEVGSATFGLQTFLYRYVCDNRIIWGATDVQELTIRHTGGAPDRFAYEGRRYLERYSNEGTGKIAEVIARAKSLEVAKEDKGVGQWLRDRGFTKPTADAAIAKAQEEEGGARSLWNIINGITAHARGVEHTDVRVDLERRAGRLMDVVA